MVVFLLKDIKSYKNIKLDIVITEHIYLNNLDTHTKKF